MGFSDAIQGSDASWSCFGRGSRNNLQGERCRRCRGDKVLQTVLGQGRVERDDGLESWSGVVAGIRTWYEASFVLVRGKRGVVSPADDARTCFGFHSLWQGCP